MSDRDITLWLDERWYRALSKELSADETLEDKLGDYLDELCNQLPKNVYEQISSEIYEEHQRSRMERQASIRYAAFKVTENGRTTCYEVDRSLEFLDAARLLRMYLRGERGASRFEQMIWNAKEISAERFSELADLRLQNTGQVTGAFEMDFDSQKLSALHIMDGWKCFNMKDVSSAVYSADRSSRLNHDERFSKFLAKLEGKELSPSSPSYLTGSERIQESQISFAEDIVENDGRLNFYLEVVFDPDKVFGTHVCTEDNDDYVNVYANYDLDAGQVCEDLSIVLVQDDADIEYLYRLSPEEQEVFSRKMDEYCRQRLGQTLENCRQEYPEDSQIGRTAPELEL